MEMILLRQCKWRWERKKEEEEERMVKKKRISQLSSIPFKNEIECILFIMRINTYYLPTIIIIKSIHRKDHKRRKQLVFIYISF